MPRSAILASQIAARRWWWHSHGPLVSAGPAWTGAARARRPPARPCPDRARRPARHGALARRPLPSRSPRRVGAGGWSPAGASGERKESDPRARGNNAQPLGVAPSIKLTYGL